MLHNSVAIFIPHMGCRHRCVFCDQHSQSGCSRPPGADEVAEVLERGLSTLQGRPARAAFFGGSFTMMDRRKRIAYLEAARPFLQGGGYEGICISTRPDGINSEILDELKGYGVIAIEIGAQSMDNEVLAANRRGHTAEDTARAAELVKAHGFELGLHMMTGMYYSGQEADLETAEKLIALKPDTVRIHPALVLRGTELEGLYQSGEYVPQTLERASELGADLLKRFRGGGINVIRVGLHDTQSLSGSVVAGPYHPAFRELCEGELMLRAALDALSPKPAGDAVLTVHPRFVSRMIGQKRKNLERLSEMGYNVKVMQDEGCGEFEVRLG